VIATQTLELATQALVAEQSRLADAEHRVSEAREALEENRAQWKLTAEAFGLQSWAGRLRELRDAMASLERALSDLWPALRLLEDAALACARSLDAVERSREDRARLSAIHQRVLEEHAAARAAQEALESTVGAKVEEVMARLDAAKKASEELHRSIQGEEVRLREAELSAAALTERVSNLKLTLDHETTQRDATISALEALAGTGILRTASPELQPGKSELSITGWVDLARRIEAALSSVDSGDAPWERRGRAIYAHFATLQAALGALSYRAEAMTESELFVVRIPFQQQLRGADEAQLAFTEEVEQRQRYLDAKEREIIENHLLGEVSTHIHDRLHAAEEWVQQVNRELDERPTSTGMKLRFEWELHEEGPTGFPPARKALMRSAAAWSEEDRLTVITFLQQRLQGERAENPHQTWFENLAAAFDYRAWHRFAVERQQDGRWQRLTKRTFGTGSGGEKAIMLTMPQFAAAAAHYRSADPSAPRLILLDEAFVGIDNDSRSKAMGLLTHFELDVLMTSEREWACYPTVPGIAIYQLAVRPGVDAVLATRWVWDGSKRIRTDGAPARLN
jgi:hypothetical protein